MAGSVRELKETKAVVQFIREKDRVLSLPIIQKSSKTENPLNKKRTK